MQYKLQISQRGRKDSKRTGKFVKAQNDADMCQKCFIDMAGRGYEPNWIAMVKNQETGKWDMVDIDE